jgi:hypothetical protein
MRKLMNPQTGQVYEVPDEQAAQYFGGNAGVSQTPSAVQAAGDISNAEVQWKQMYDQAQDLKTKNSIATAYKNYKDAFGQPAAGVDAKTEQAKTTADRIVSQLEDMYFGKVAGEKPLYTSDIPLVNLVQGLISEKASKIPGANPQLKTYLNTLETVKPFLAKAAGQTGQLNEKEQERAVKQLPTSFSTQDEARRGFNAFRLIMGLPLKNSNLNLNNSAQTPAPQISSPVAPKSNLIIERMK